MLYRRPVIIVRLLAGLVQSDKRGRDWAHVRGDNLRWKTTLLAEPDSLREQKGLGLAARGR